MKFMKQLKKATAYYHLPGLFEFYELYREFLPLFCEHREYFYDWCEIGSVYGAPADCIWGGGRMGEGNHDPEEVLALMQEYGISARLTFSNSMLEERHLLDPKCNRLCAVFEKKNQTRHRATFGLSEKRVPRSLFCLLYHKGADRFSTACEGNKP